MSRKMWLLVFGLLVLLLAACGAEEGGSEKTIYVGPELKDCVGVAPQQCLQVKESPDAEYTNFYGDIEGFEFESGYEYELVVREEEVENPPADGSSIRWILVEEVNRTQVTTAAEAEEPPAETAPEDENVITVYVGPELVDCVGVAPQQCLQVKESPDAEYGLFYGNIEGFNFEPGFEYELRVRVEQVENPPADGSSLNYTLVEIVSQNPVEGMQVSGAPAQPGLEGSRWVLSSYAAEDGTLTEALELAEVTIEFTDGSFFGNAGCNSYNGGYTLEGNNLSIPGPIASTLMMCAPMELADQEARYLSLLEQVSGYQIADGQLTITDVDGNTLLVYEASEPAALTGTLWTATAYNNGQQAVVGVLQGTELTAQFEDGRVAGSAGCNSYSGSYTAEDGALSIDELANTEVFCAEPEGIMDQESQFLAALQAATRYEISGDQLELFDDSGARQATFVAAGAMEAGEGAEVSEITLQGTDWALDTFYLGETASSVLAGSEVTALFGEDGSLVGSAGCNRYNASYTLEGDVLTIGPAAATRMFCAEPAGVMEQETRFLAALDDVQGYQIEDDTLTLFDADGNPLLGFKVAQ